MKLAGKLRHSNDESTEYLRILGSTAILSSLSFPLFGRAGTRPGRDLLRPEAEASSICSWIGISPGPQPFQGHRSGLHFALNATENLLFDQLSRWSTGTCPNQYLYAGTRVLIVVVVTGDCTRRTRRLQWHIPFLSDASDASDARIRTM